MSSRIVTPGMRGRGAERIDLSKFQKMDAHEAAVEASRMWATCPALREEFHDEKSLVGYCKALSAGTVRFLPGGV